MKNCDMETPRQPLTVRSMQHLEFQPRLFSGKKYLQQEWKASYDLHKRKVMSAKPTIDTTPPKTYSHLKLKKHEEEWKRKIEKENNKIMEKISHIMRTHGGVDHRNNYDKKSLGKEKRQQELLRITKENQIILLRLSQCKPFYNVKSWHEDWLKTLKMMDRITHYPGGRAHQQKEQEKPIRKCSAFDKEQRSALMQPETALQATRPIAKQSLRKNEKRKETNKKEGTGTEIQQDKVTYPASQLNESEKSISPGTPGNPGSSETTQITADKPPVTAETFSSENTPHTPKTLEHETASPAEG